MKTTAKFPSVRQLLKHWPDYPTKEHLPLSKSVGWNHGDGYLYCVAPFWYTGKTTSHKAAPVHLVTWCAYNFRFSVPVGCHVHHVDHDRTNNHIDNLVLMSESDHLSLHANCETRKLKRKVNYLKHSHARTDAPSKRKPYGKRC